MVMFSETRSCVIFCHSSPFIKKNSTITFLRVLAFNYQRLGNNRTLIQFICMQGMGDFLHDLINRMDQNVGAAVRYFDEFYSYMIFVRV